MKPRQINAEQITHLFAQNLNQREVANRLGIDQKRLSATICERRSLYEAKQRGIAIAQGKQNDFKHLFEDYAPGKADELKNYIALVEKTLNARWQTIGDLKRKLGAKYNDRLTADALEYLGDKLEIKGAVRTFYRRK